jgi:hypothetical protein
MRTGKLAAAIRKKYKTPAHAVMAALDCSLEEAERLLAAECRHFAQDAFPGMALDEKGQPPMAWVRRRNGYAWDQDPDPDGQATLEEIIEKLLDEVGGEAEDALFTRRRGRRARDTNLDPAPVSTMSADSKSFDRRFPASTRISYDGYAAEPRRAPGVAADFDKRFPSSTRIGSLD